MIKIFEKTTKAKYLSKQRPNSLLTTLPSSVRDYLELQHGSTLTWTGYVDKNGEKCIKVTKQD